MSQPVQDSWASGVARTIALGMAFAASADLRSSGPASGFMAIEMPATLQKLVLLLVGRSPAAVGCERLAGDEGGGGTREELDRSDRVGRGTETV